MSSTIFAKKLADEMKRQNWTGRSLSQKANLSYNAVHYILSGKTKSTNFEVVSAIANVLGVSPLYLLGQEQNKSQKHSEKEWFTPEKQKLESEIPYDGELYRKIMSIVEKLLAEKHSLTTQKIEYFTHYVYSQIKKMNSKDAEKNIKSYAEGIIDYVLNREE